LFLILCLFLSINVLYAGVIDLNVETIKAIKNIEAESSDLIPVNDQPMSDDTLGLLRELSERIKVEDVIENVEDEPLSSESQLEIIEPNQQATVKDEAKKSNNNSNSISKRGTMARARHNLPKATYAGYRKIHAEQIAYPYLNLLQAIETLDLIDENGNVVKLLLMKTMRTMRKNQY